MTHVYEIGHQNALLVLRDRTARSSGCGGHNENQVVLGKNCCGAENSAKAAGVGLHLSITSSSKSAVTSREEQHKKPKWLFKETVHPKIYFHL